jgi:hypothetical protein
MPGGGRAVRAEGAAAHGRRHGLRDVGVVSADAARLGQQRGARGQQRRLLRVGDRERVEVAPPYGGLPWRGGGAVRVAAVSGARTEAAPPTSDADADADTGAQCVRTAHGAGNQQTGRSQGVQVRAVRL